MVRPTPPRIRLIQIDESERPIRAILSTEKGLVRVRWQMKNRKWIWTARGNAKAIYIAEPAIEHIQQFCQSLI